MNETFLMRAWYCDFDFIVDPSRVRKEFISDSIESWNLQSQIVGNVLGELFLWNECDGFWWISVISEWWLVMLIVSFHILFVWKCDYWMIDWRIQRVAKLLKFDSTGNLHNISDKILVEWWRKISDNLLNFECIPFDALCNERSSQSNQKNHWITQK
jgi:hypothetical protein